MSASATTASNSPVLVASPASIPMPKPASAVSQEHLPSVATSSESKEEAHEQALNKDASLAVEVPTASSSSSSTPAETKPDALLAALAELKVRPEIGGKAIGDEKGADAPATTAATSSTSGVLPTQPAIPEPVQATRRKRRTAVAQEVTTVRLIKYGPLTEESHKLEAALDSIFGTTRDTRPQGSNGTGGVRTRVRETSADDSESVATTS